MNIWNQKKIGIWTVRKMIFVLLSFTYTCFAADRFAILYSWSPLIGGPKFLPIHIKTIISDNKCQEKLTLDFIPEIPSMEELMANNLKLLQGRNIKGVIRTVLHPSYSIGVAASDNALFEISTKILAENAGKNELNLYKNNCYHFAYRVSRTVRRFNSTYQSC